MGWVGGGVGGWGGIPVANTFWSVLGGKENVEPMVLELGGEGGAQANPLSAGLDALWSGERSFPPIVDIPPDADDETMVELAIALSLQDQVGPGARRWW